MEEALVEAADLIDESPADEKDRPDEKLRLPPGAVVEA
jgi:hypothetical protein